MFLSSRRPKREVLRVKVEGSENEFELWLLEPTLLGRAMRYPNKAVAEDGAEGKNLTEIARHLLTLRKDPLAKEGNLSQEVILEEDRKQTVRYTVKQLIAHGAWDKFVKRRKLSAKGVNIDHVFDLTPDEIRTLKL